MKEKIKYIIGLISYIIAFLLIGYYLILEFSIINITSPITRIKIILFVIILMYLGSFSLNKTNNQLFRKLPKINLWIWFILYVIMLLNLTLFDKYFGRSGISFYIYNNETIKDYINYSINIIPFKTIHNYFLAFNNGNLNSHYFIYNILGNIIAFMPFSFLIPRLFKKINKWYKFFAIVSLFIIVIEILQMVMMSGSLDIDDYILNISGAIILYFILNNKYINKMVNKFFSII